MIGALILKTMMDSGTNVMNERDVDAILKHWRDDAVMIYPGNTIVSGRHEGRAAMEKFFSRFMEQFPEHMEFTTNQTYIKNMLAIGLSNTVVAEFSVSYTNKHGERFENSGVSVVTIRNGKVAQIKDYYFDVERLNAAWRQ